MLTYTTIHKPGIADPVIAGSTPALCEGGAGWRGTRHVANLYDWDAGKDARENKPGSLYPPIIDTALTKYVADIAASKPPLFLSNYAENREYGPNRLYHLQQQAKMLTGIRSTGVPTALFDFPHANASNAENDYAWRYLKSKVDAICIGIYFGEPTGVITPSEFAQIARKWSEATRLAGSTKSVGIVISAFTHDGRAIEPSKRAELAAIIVALNPDFVVIWSDQPAAKENAELVNATAKMGMQE